MVFIVYLTVFPDIPITFYRRFNSYFHNRIAFLFVSQISTNIDVIALTAEYEQSTKYHSLFKS
jgi:hypothetical protein